MEILNESHPHEYREIQMLRDGHLADYLNFDVRTTEGENESLLNRFKERGFPEVLLISFMSEWCPNCHYEGFLLKDVYDSWKERGLEVLLVVEYSDRAKWENLFVKPLGINLPTVFGELSEKDEVRKLSTSHHRVRIMMGDERNWGVPLHLLIVRGKLGDIHYVTGEFQPGALEAFVEVHVV